MKIYDLIILGAGPAGLSAAIYAGRAMLDTLIIEKGQDGGQILQTAEIENYPGSVVDESGSTLIERMASQAKEFGTEKIYDTVKDVTFEGEIKEVICERATYQAKAIIIAGGATSKSIGCVGEEEFVGRGISHCATCDGPFFRNLDVFVIGGGNAALEEALFLTKFAKKVTIIHRRRVLKADKTLQDRAFKNEKISFLYHTVIKEIRGDGVIESMTLENVKDGSTTEVKADPNDGTFGVFVFIGYKPNTDLFKGKIDISEKGYIITNDDMNTNVAGVFAAVQAGKYIEETEEK